MGPKSLDDLVNTKYHIYAIKGDQQIDIARFLIFSPNLQFNLRSKNELESQEILGYTKILLSKIIDHGANLGLLDLNCDIEADCYNPTENLKNKYQKMLENGTFSDCVIKVRERLKEIPGPRRRAAITAQSHNLLENVWPFLILVSFSIARSGESFYTKFGKIGKS
ncbi:unnamed protein product [Meloidogyne enterolobii]|uniref:Uncharacterized protein n=1 Tax=Meloidogyne enterolobii TaxID=390850 RepID=A0ACB0YGL6_MELEN